MKAKYLILVVLLISATSLVYGANFYAVASGSWANASTWSNTSGGAGGAGVPTSADDVYIGEGSGTYTVTVPVGNYSAGLLYIGSAAGNAAGATLNLAGFSSTLNVSGTLYMYRATAASTRVINVGDGNLTVNSDVHISVPGGTDLGSVCKITINGGTAIIRALKYYAVPAAPQQAQVVFTGAGSMQVRGNFDLVNNAGVLVPGFGTVYFNATTHQTIESGPDILFYNTNMNNATGFTLNGLMIVNGTWNQGAGITTGTLPNVDGYRSIDYDWIQILANDNMINGFWVNMTTPPLYPQYVNRQWEIGGVFEGPKTITYYWYHADDFNYSWAGKTVATWHNGNPGFGAFNTDDNPHYIQTIVNPADAPGIYNIGLFPAQTLPVEFSSFNAVLNAQNYVQLNWITQTESSMLGYNVYRNVDNSLETAMLISPLIMATNTSTLATYSYLDSEVENGVFYYWVQSMELNGSTEYHGSIKVTIEDIVVPPITSMTVLGNAYPNPFKANTSINVQVKSGETAKVTIYNLAGQAVQTYSVNEGNHSINWDGRDSKNKACVSGVYFYKLTSPSMNQTKKLVIVK